MNQTNAAERLLTLQQLAECLDIPYWKLQRAAKRGEVPYYTPFNGRKLFKLWEVRAAIEATRVGAP